MAKETRQERKARKAANQTAIRNLNPDIAKNGEKLDINLEVVASPKLAVLKAANERGPTFKPVTIETDEQGKNQKGSTKFLNLYERTTLEADGQKVRTKTYRGGKKTKVETFEKIDGELTRDGKQAYKRTGKKVEKGNSSREVAYHDDGRKTVTKTGFFGTKTTRITPKDKLPDDAGVVDKFKHLFSRPKTKELHVKRLGYEKRYETVGNDEVLVARKYGPFSQYTKIDKDGSKLTKTKYLGGLISNTVKITGEGKDAEVAKRNFLKRVNTYINDDGTKNTIERQKGWIKKSTKQEFSGGKNGGEDTIKETVTTKRFGGLLNRTTTNVRTLTADEQKVQNQRALPGAEKAAEESTTRLATALKDLQKNPKNDSLKVNFQQATNSYIQTTSAYYDRRQKIDPNIKFADIDNELEKKIKRRENIENLDIDETIKELSKHALEIVESRPKFEEANRQFNIIAKNTGEHDKTDGARTAEANKYRAAHEVKENHTKKYEASEKQLTENAQKYADYMNTKDPADRKLTVEGVKEEFLAKAKEIYPSIQKAKARQTPLPSEDAQQAQEKFDKFVLGDNKVKPGIGAVIEQLRGLEDRSRAPQAVSRA